MHSFFTSPPTDVALKATPLPFRNDERIDEIRMIAAAGECSPNDENYYCHIPFRPLLEEDEDHHHHRVGIIFYGGAMVDPRSYSPIAKILTEKYSLPVVIPIFEDDIPFHFVCAPSGRVAMAAAQFDYVENWVLVGHSLGTLTATFDAWIFMTTRMKTTTTTTTNNTTTTTTTTPAVDNTNIVGLVLLAGYVSAEFGCEEENVDFSSSRMIVPPDFPMAVVYATEDRIINMTRFNESRHRTTNNATFVLINGGNHRQFGSYNDSQRFEKFGLTQLDGVPLIPPETQWNISTKVIFDVVSQSIGTTTTTTTANNKNVADVTQNKNGSIDYNENDNFLLYDNMISPTWSAENGVALPPQQTSTTTIRSNIRFLLSLIGFVVFCRIFGGGRRRIPDLRRRLGICPNQLIASNPPRYGVDF